MEIFLKVDTWVALLTLTFLEIVLGVDNIIFISIVSNKLPETDRAKARNIGLSIALILRIGLLIGVTYIIGFKKSLFVLLGHGFSIRDIILLSGGIFLLFKSTLEIHHKMEGMTEQSNNRQIKATFLTVIVQITLLDIIFSFDSILTAIGLTKILLLMVIAIIITMFIMMAFSGGISTFISNHPSIEILALSFLILIGFMLIIEALGHHVPKGYIYFAVFFSLIVEVINIRVRKQNNPIKLNRKREL